MTFWGKQSSQRTGKLGPYDIAWDQFSGFDFRLSSVANDGRFHGNVAFQTCNNIGSLFLLVPTNGGVEKKNEDDDTKIDPISKTSSQEDGELHD